MPETWGPQASREGDPVGSGTPPGQPRRAQQGAIAARLPPPLSTPTRPRPRRTPDRCFHAESLPQYRGPGPRAGLRSGHFLPPESVGEEVCAHLQADEVDPVPEGIRDGLGATARWARPRCRVSSILKSLSCHKFGGWTRQLYSQQFGGCDDLQKPPRYKWGYLQMVGDEFLMRGEHIGSIRR